MRDQQISTFALPALALALALATACGPGRTAAATQPTPAAFEPGKSQPQALVAVDKMIEQLGGAAAWDAVKQIRWEKKYFLDGKLTAWYRHAWDIWNGRHRFEAVDMASWNAEQADPTQKHWANLAMYDLFNRDKGAVFPRMVMTQQAPKADRDQFIAVAYKTWQQDAYELAMMHKLQDPGVILTYAGEVVDLQGKCMPSCAEIKVTFEPSVGEDVYYVDINTQTNLPEVYQKERGSGRIAFSIDEWTEAGGLKFPKKMQNLGATGEVITIENVRVGEPDDELYVPPVF